VGSKNQLKAWNEIRKVSYAKTVSYNFISKKTKIHPRHVGRICGENKLLLFIPCHRVIRSDGLLGGFSAKRGVKLKSKILKIEELNK
jgi:methylated-DNA-[protein]-cysteine S-methyltransferase